MRNRFQTIHVVMHFLGSLLLALGCILFIPLLSVFLSGEFYHDLRTFFAFSTAIVVSFITGLSLKITFRGGTPYNVHALLICGLGWIAVSLIGAIPFVIGLGASFLDAFFETVSGFTTTGITLFTGLDEMPRSILLWRSITQWVGGLGILSFFLAVVFRRGSAHRLFGAESHKIDSGRPVPGLQRTLKILWGIYAGFTAFIVLSLICAGMSPFDSLCHSFTALSTGGFSPHDASIGYYRIASYPHFVWIEYILILGMIMGGTNFIIHYRLLKGNGRALFDTTEMKYWWGFIAAFVCVIFSTRLIQIVTLPEITAGDFAFMGRLEENFRVVLFQVVSIITTTGFATRDIGSAFFGHLAKQLFIVMMIIGGCVGSTGGGVKVLRVAILVRLIRRECYRLRTPLRAVSTILIDGKPVRAEEIQRVSALFFTWIVLLAIGGGITALLSQVDEFSAFSGMCSALGNIGPCYISVSEMGALHPCVKLTYILGMLAGRLEILPILLLFSPRAWR